MSHIKVEVTHHPENKYASITFTPREDTQKSRDDLDFITKTLLGPADRRGGMVPGNKVKVDVRYDKDDYELQKS